MGTSNGGLMVEFMKKILVAEDDKGLSYSIDTWLTLEGFEVVTVYNGEEAFNALKNHPYDLLSRPLKNPNSLLFLPIHPSI